MDYYLNISPATNFLSICFCIALLFTLPACKKTKDIQANQSAEMTIEMYCAGPQYVSDSNYFRSNGLGESVDEPTAKKKALSTAKANLATAIRNSLEHSLELYLENNRTEKDESFDLFRSVTREVVNQDMSGGKAICDKTLHDVEDSNYQHYVVLELSVVELLEDVNRAYSNDERLNGKYDFEEFRQFFDQAHSEKNNR